MLLLYRDIQNNFIEVELPTEGGIVGYEADNFIVLDAIGISGKHMRLSAVGNHLFVEDLQSLNGTYINQKLSSEKTQLFDGDLVQIGLLQLRFNFDSNSWTMTAETPASSVFLEAQYEKSDSQEFEDVQISTAVTVIASPEIKAAIKSGNISALTTLEATQPANIIPPTRFSLENLKELGKYNIIKKIGKGGMGIVFLARHKNLNSYRALKVLPHSVKEENHDFYERFMREARIASEIRHPNIVGVIDAEVDIITDVSYIVMEFIDGGNLRRILKTQKKLSEIQVLFIARSVAAALKGIAEHNIVHRDIKPDNIMFTRQGEVKLADLGIAKNDNDNANITQNDAMIGTPAYLSPEQIENPKAVDIRSDIYSLGVTLYEMLTGSIPYTGKNTYDIVHKMLSESIPDPRLKNPSISSVTAKIVMKMLQKNPLKRYQSPQVLLNVLARILPQYTGREIQEIIKSAIMGTALPKGVNASLNTGVGSLISFLFYSFRPNMLHPFEKVKKEKFSNVQIPKNEASLFCLSAGQEKISIKDFAVEIKTTPNMEFQLISADGFSTIVKSNQEGIMQIKNIPLGKYILSSREGHSI